MAVAELAAAAGLLLVARLGARLLADRLEVRHARLVQLDVDAEAALAPLDRDLDVHLADAGEQLLARLLVAAQAQRRVLLGQPAQRRRDLLLVALRLRRDGEAHHRLGEADLGQLELDARASSSRSPVCTSFSFATAPMSPGPELRRAGVLLALRAEQRADALLRVRARVDERRVGPNVPWRTRKRLIRPANGSAIVLKTKAAVSAPSMCVIEPAFFAGRRDALDDQVEQRRGCRGSWSRRRRRPGRARRA